MRTDERGAILVPLALTVSVLTLAVTIVIDTGLWRAQAIKLQRAADFAALSAANAIVAGSSEPIDDLVDDVLARNGVDIRVGQGAVVATPPSTGSAAGDPSAVSVSLTGAFPPLFARALSPGGLNLTRTATARGAEEQASCILALDDGNTPGALTFTSINNAVIDCVPVANSSATNAIDLNSINGFTAESLFTAGDFVFIGNNFQLTESAQTEQSPVADPYRLLRIPFISSCDHSNRRFNNATLSPGIYCGSIRFNNRATMNPGTYYFFDSNLDLSGLTSLTCNCPNPEDGVTFVFTGSPPNYASNFQFNSINLASLQAPSDPGAHFPGILIYVDRRAAFATQTFSSINDATINGAIYAPSQKLLFQSINGANTNCNQVVALQLEFRSINAFGTSQNCSDYGTETITIGGGNGALNASLVE